MTSPSPDVNDDPLHAVYSDDILERIDRVLAPSPAESSDPRPASGRHRLRGHAAGVALATATVTGVRDALDDDVADRAIETFDPTWGVAGGPHQAVTLFFVPNDPFATRAIVRPWLLPSAVAPTDSVNA